MYARSPKLSRYRRRSSAANYRLLDDEQYSLNTSGHTNHDHRRLLPSLNRQHCGCCSMSTSDLLSSTSASFEEVEARDADTVHQGAEQTWRPFDDDDANMESLSSLSAAQHRRDRRSASRTPSIVSTLSSPNILMLGAEGQQTITSDNGNRLRERLAASVAGLKELDILREKHRKMVEELKSQLRLSATEMAHRQQSTADSYSNGQTIDPRSPSPAELSSNISHRSSLSMDSGVCLSLTSDPASINGMNGYRPLASSYYPHHGHQRRLSTDSVSGYGHNYLSPIRKTSWTMSSASALYDALANTNNGGSDDEGCYPTTAQAQDATAESPRAYSSLASITAALAAAEASVAPPRAINGAQLRYRRRFDGSSANGSGGSLALSRPRSLYNCYPEENAVIVETTVSPRQVYLAQQPSNMRLLRRTSVQYRPQVPTIVANLPETKSNLHSDMGWDTSTVICRRRPNGGRTSAVDPVFRASRVFIDTLPENEALLDPYMLQIDADFRNGVSMRPRRYETRRPRPTSMAVPPSVSTPVLATPYYPPSSSPSSAALKKQNSADLDHLNEWRRGHPSNSFTWEEAKRVLDPAFATRSSSSSTLVRQHSTASAASKSPKISSRRHSKSPVLRNGYCHKGEVPSMLNVSVVTTGDMSSNSSSCGVISDGSEGSSVLVVNGSSYGHSQNNNGAANGGDDHKSISRSVSSQSSDSSKSRRNKEKTWRESPNL